MTIAKISLHCILRFPLEEIIRKMKIKKNTLSFKKSCLAYFLRQSNLCVFKITYHAMAFSLSFSRYMEPSTRSAQIQWSIKQKKVAFQNIPCRLSKASLSHTPRIPFLIVKSRPSQKLLYNEMKSILMIFMLFLFLVVEDQ